MKLGLSFELFIIKSPTSVLGLIPLNVVSILFKGKSSIVLLPFSIISSIPSLEVVTYSSDFALGPSKRLPSTVGVTNIPLLFLLGTWNRVFYKSLQQLYQINSTLLLKGLFHIFLHLLDYL